MNKKPRSYHEDNIYVDDNTSQNDCFYITRYYDGASINFDELELSSEEMEKLYKILKEVYNETI